jgi:hypothetical protein
VLEIDRLLIDITCPRATALLFSDEQSSAELTVVYDNTFLLALSSTLHVAFGFAHLCLPFFHFATAADTLPRSNAVDERPVQSNVPSELTPGSAKRSGTHELLLQLFVVICHLLGYQCASRSFRCKPLLIEFVRGRCHAGASVAHIATPADNSAGGHRRAIYNICISRQQGRNVDALGYVAPFFLYSSALRIARVFSLHCVFLRAF